MLKKNLMKLLQNILENGVGYHYLHFLKNSGNSYKKPIEMKQRMENASIGGDI